MAIAKRIGAIIGVIVAVILVAAGIYIAYLQMNYYRIDDHQSLQIEANQGAMVETGQTYSIATYNVGFGAYSPEFSFFVDAGNVNGKPTSGTRATAISEADVHKNTDGAIELLKRFNSDFAILQEVDTGSTRDYNVDQLSAIATSMNGYTRVYAINSHTPFLAYPPTNMYGVANSGLLTMARFRVTEAERYSYPVSLSFIEKFVDLDRCFSVTRVPVAGGRELVIVNSHMSAYDEGNSSKQAQMDFLNEFAASEYARGNYVILGGDWNQSFIDYKTYPTQETVDNQILLDNDSFAKGFSIVYPTNINAAATCRNADIPYEKGVSLQLCIDGFVVSDNIVATAEIFDSGYAYSDHNPVVMRFTLK